MVLESLESETPNIKDLSIEEEPKEEILFDPDKEFIKEDWQKIADLLDREIQEVGRTGKNIPYYMSLIVRMRMLSPEKFANIPLSRKFFDWFKDGLKYSTKIDDYFDLGYLKILDPTKLQPSEYENKFLPMWISVKNEREISAFLFKAKELKLLFPLKEFNLDVEEKFRKLKEQLEVWRIDIKGIPHIIEYIFRNTANAKLIFPDHDTKSLITEEDWTRAREQLGTLRVQEGGIWDFISLASNMRILAAKEARITDQGIKLTMPGEESSQHSPPLPQQRSF